LIKVRTMCVMKIIVKIMEIVMWPIAFIAAIDFILMEKFEDWLERKKEEDESSDLLQS